MRLTKKNLIKRMDSGTNKIIQKKFISFSLNGKTENWKLVNKKWNLTCTH